MKVRRFFSKFMPQLFQKQQLNVQECPNCWGRQEWCEQYLPKSFDWNKYYTLNGTPKKTFILKFVEKYL